MPLVSQNVPSLLDGISQLPPNRRKTGEGTAQVNGYDNLGRGKQKRPPLQYLAKLTASITGYDSAFIHTISRDIAERYHVLITDGDLRVYDAFNGEERSVAFPDGKGYLTVVPQLSTRGDSFIEPTNLVAITAHSVAGSNWFQWLGKTVSGAPSTSRIVNNEAFFANDGFGTKEVYLFPTVPPTADYTVRARVRSDATGTDAVGLVLRGIAGVGGYAAILQWNGTPGQGFLRVHKLNADGTFGTDIGTLTGFTFDPLTYYTLEARIAGTRIDVYLDGVQKLGINDATFPLAGRAGFVGQGSATSGRYTRLDDWSLDYSIPGRDQQDTAVKAFRAVTVGDYTFITNRATTVAKTANVVAARPPEALVFVRQADYSTTYRLTVDSTTLTYTTGDGATPASRAGITTDNIAEQLRLLFVAGALNATHLITRTGSTLYIKRINSGAFTISATDGLSDNAILAIKGSIQRFDDLPLRAVNGVIIEVTGDPGSQFDNYHVVYDDSGSAGNAGVWRETVKAGEQYQLDPATMPHVLVKSGSGFVFQNAAWRGREVGSIVTNPFPSFTGKKIKEVFFTQGRFGVTSGENVILSGTSDVFNFFRKSAKALYDNDPIDISSASDKISNWHSVVEWNEQPLLWSDQGQSVLSGVPILSPKTVALQSVGSYENQATVRPRVIGNSIYFAQIINGKTRLSEWSLPPNASMPVAVDVTGHIPSYIVGNITSIAGTDQPGLVAVTTDTKQNSLYVYSHDQDNESWSRWDIEATSRIVAVDFLGGAFGVVTKRSDGVYLEKIDLGSANLLAYEGDVAPVLLDHFTTPAGTTAGGLTTYALPFSVATDGSQGEVVLFRTDTKVEVASTRPSATTVRSLVDLTGVPVTVGIRYTFSFTLSPISVARTQRDGTTQRETAGRLIVRFVKLWLSDTAYLKVVVTPTEGGTYTYVFSTPTPLNSDDFQFPVQSEAATVGIVLSSDQAVGCVLSSFDWEGTQVVRSQRQ